LRTASPAAPCVGRFAFVLGIVFCLFALAVAPVLIFVIFKFGFRTFTEIGRPIVEELFDLMGLRFGEHGCRRAHRSGTHFIHTAAVLLSGDGRSNYSGKSDRCNKQSIFHGGLLFLTLAGNRQFKNTSHCTTLPTNAAVKYEGRRPAISPSSPRA
jgi:hypothetical protein